MAENKGLRIESGGEDELDLDWNYDLIDALNRANEFAEKESGEPAIMIAVREPGTLAVKYVKAVVVEVDGDEDSKDVTIYLEIGR